MKKKDNIFTSIGPPPAKGNFLSEFPAWILSIFEEVKFAVYIALSKFFYRLTPKRFFLRISSPKTVLFYPDFPELEGYSVSKVCHLLGYKMTNDPKDNAHLAVHWEDVTKKTSRPEFEDIKGKGKFLNSRCTDISKANVQNIFEEVFGYKLAVDPLSFQGTCVMKSNDNSQHDGQIVHCPISENELNKDYVYQKLIDNQSDEFFAKDIRLPIFQDQIPFVYLRYRPLTDRFGDYRKSLVAKGEVSDILSEEEVQSVLLFCQKVGLDYGELDVLRDKNDKRIYIVDVNDTPWGQPKCRSARDHWKALKLMSETFERVFICK